MINVNTRIAIFSDCNSPGGVWVYSLRTANMFVDDPAVSCTLVTHPPRTSEEHQRIDLATSVFNHIVYIRRPKSDTEPDNDLPRELALLLNEQDINVYIPNYRNYTYVALHWLNKGIMAIGVCHNNHASYYNVLKRYITLLDGIICPNSEAANVLNLDLERFNTPISYIPHYIEPLSNTCHPSPTKLEIKKTINLIYFGRIEKEQKEVFELLKVVNELKSKDQSVLLVVVGEGSEKNNFINEVDSQELGSEVAIYDAMERSALLPLITQSDFSLITSKYEGFCYSAAESMLLGVPVACYMNNAMSDYVTNMDNGIVVSWGDANALADGLVAVIGDEERYKKMSTAAKNTIINEFSETKVRTQYKHFFDHLFKVKKEKYWPRLRPVIEPKGKQVVGRLFEGVGKKMGVWF